MLPSIDPNILYRWMIHESIWIIFRGFYDEDFLFLEDSFFIESIDDRYTTHSYEYRVQRRKYPYIDDDESGYFFLEEKSRR